MFTPSNNEIRILLFVYIGLPCLLVGGIIGWLLS